MSSGKRGYEGYAVLGKARGRIRGAKPALWNAWTIGSTTLVVLAAGFILTRDESRAAPPNGIEATSAGLRRVTTPPPEAPDDPPAPAESLSLRAEGPRGVYTRAAFTSVQVNVNGAGNNIVGDAANEPTMAMSPASPNKMAIGWRQFDTIASNFRQAGRAYTTNGGQNWTFPGVLTPGQFRSDPVMDSDAAGNFFFSSLSSSTDSSERPLNYL